MATRYKSVEAAQLVPLESFHSDPGAQSNMTDPDSRIMKKSTHAEYTQSYNAQAVVDAEVSMMVLGFRQFLLRGLNKVNLEWQLVSCAYNLKRLAVLVR